MMGENKQSEQGTKHLEEEDKMLKRVIMIKRYGQRRWLDLVLPS